MTNEQFHDFAKSLEGTGAIVHRRKYNLFAKIVDGVPRYKLIGIMQNSDEPTLLDHESPEAAFRSAGLTPPESWEDYCIQAHED